VNQIFKECSFVHIPKHATFASNLKEREKRKEKGDTGDKPWQVFREVFCKAKEKSQGPKKEEHNSPGSGTVEIVQHSRKQEKYVPDPRCNRSTRSLPPIILFAHGCVTIQIPYRDT
jgi:hypothetical protein